MELFVFDIDSTLYDEEAREFPRDSVEALAQLQSLGHTVVVATGRPPFKARKIFEAGIYPDYLICNNGHVIFDKDGKVVYEHRFPRELGIAVTDYCRDKGLGLIWSYVDDIHYYYPAPYLEVIKKRTDPQGLNVGDSGIHLEENPLGACIAGSEEELTLFKDEFKGQATIVSINSEYGDLVLHGESKWEALKRVCALLSIPTEETMAFGDNFNDAELVTHCGIGVCMGNGTQDLKAVADYITTGVGDKGIANALRHFNIL